MRADLLIKGKTLTGSSDLTLLAPLRQGLVPSLESVSYKTRVQRLLKLLGGARGSSHEFSWVRPISDSVERVGRIHSVRVAVFERYDLVMLAVTFDGTWETYIRVLWQKVGALLDAIFCNTEGYVLSSGGFEAWRGWVERVQVETGFFFNTHALTVDDVHWLRAAERLQGQDQREAAEASLADGLALALTRLHTPTAEERAWAFAAASSNGGLDAVRQGLQSLALVFRLTELYMPGTEDGDVLLRAARELLLEFVALTEDRDMPPEIMAMMRMRFARQLDWLRAADRPELTRPRVVPALPERPALAAQVADIQGGVLAGYSEVTHACLVLLAFDSPAAGARLIEHLLPKVTRAIDPTGQDEPWTHPIESVAGGLALNIAVTVDGLRRLGYSEADLQRLLPAEFIEGMEARSSILGDVRANHPRRWSLPQANWPRFAQGAGREVRMSAVHMVVQLRRFDDTGNRQDEPSHPDYLFHSDIQGLVTSGGQALAGVQVLSIQPMRRQFRESALPNGPRQTIEHFGFADGGGQPVYTATGPGAAWGNQVHLGEVLHGYDNEADPATAQDLPSQAGRREFLRNGSFMVVRKLRQDVPALRRAVRQAAAQTGLRPSVVLARMMGRWQDGSSLVTHPDAPGGGEDNDFDYEADPEGRRCPLHAHARRANPRLRDLGRGEPPGRRRPRIVRRGMSYGPPADARPGDDDNGDILAHDATDRGLVFIAYNASLAEQFEVVQRWLSGGNSTGGYSGSGDPFLGVPEPGEQRHYRFETADARGCPVAHGMALDRGPQAFEEPEPFVRLQWGAYLFLPALHTLRALAERGAQPPASQVDPAAGRAQLEALIDLGPGDPDSPDTDPVAQAWKAAVEDGGARETLQTASLWAALRARGGALRTPYGVVVASRELVDEVLGDDTRFSVSGYHQRMAGSQLDIYLGLDCGDDYLRLSTAANEAIGRITQAQAFDLAYHLASKALNDFIRDERRLALGVGATRWELNLDAREVIDKVLQGLCQVWFGLPLKDGDLVPGSWHWDWKPGDPPIYPAHFTPPSRYFFQPRPNAQVRDRGNRHAATLVDAMTRFVAGFRRSGEPVRVTLPAGQPHWPAGQDAPLAQPILKALTGESSLTVARTLVGVMMGYLPTLDGNLRLALAEWQRLDRIAELRVAWAARSAAAQPAQPTLAMARELIDPALREALQTRPSPELVWRTVLRDGDQLGGIPLRRGDIVVASLTSALHQAREQGDTRDLYPMFGGQRRAPAACPHAGAGRAGPTHACPGYEAAIGVMLGVLSAFIAVPEVLRPTAAPLAFTLDGPLGGPVAVEAQP